MATAIAGRGAAMTATQDRPVRAPDPSAVPSPAAGHASARRVGRRLLGVGGTAAGQALGLVFGGVARLRGDRPLHPRGATYAARVTVSGHAGSGVPWLDEPGDHDATMRVSRAAGLPSWLPDVYGVALRLGRDTGTPVDLLFATTGNSAVGRFVLMPTLRMGGAQLTTLLPVRSSAGPLLLRLVGDDPPVTDAAPVPGRLVLSWATGRGPWHEAGHVSVGVLMSPDVDAERHDPVVHQLTGTDQYGVIARLREPAYRAARAVRPQAR
jgi:hypothetical protein